MVLDAGADAGVEVVAHLALVVAMQLFAQKGRNVFRFDGVDQGFQEMGVEARKVAGVLKTISVAYSTCIRLQW